MGLAATKPRAQIWGKILLIHPNRRSANQLCSELHEFGLETQTADSVDAAQELLLHEHFHAIIASVSYSSLPPYDFSELSKQLEALDIPILLTTATLDQEAIRAIFQCKALELFVEPFSAEKISESLQAHWEEPRGLNGILDHYLDENHLTAKEKSVARLLLKGLSNKEIAAVENLCLRTVKCHITHIFLKCGVTTRSELFSAIFPI